MKSLRSRPDGIDATPEGEPAAIDDGLSHIDGEMSETHY